MESKRHQVQRNSLFLQCLVLLEPYKLSGVPRRKANRVAGLYLNVKLEGLYFLFYMLEPHYTRWNIQKLLLN